MISASLLVPKLGPPVALQLFDQAIQPNSSIAPDLITINTMLRHHARTPDLSAMSSLFSLAEKLKLKPDVVTYTTLVQGLLRAGELEMAKKTFGTMAAQGLEPNERMCSMLVADLAKSGRSSGLANAEDLLAEMRRRKMKVGVITWTALVSGYFRGGWEEDAWAAVKRMEDQGLPLNRVAYNILLRQSGDVAQERGKGWSISLFERMIKEGVNPSSDTYVIVLAPLIRAKRWNLADNVVRHMDKLGFVPEKAALRMLIRKVRQRRANI
jgi:pentatricopeptide repeat protein